MASPQPFLDSSAATSDAVSSGNDPARVLADVIHRLRQPLSTIEACAFYLTLVLPEEDDKSREQVNRIEQQIAEASRILMDAARHAVVCQATRAGVESRSRTSEDIAVVT